MKKIHTPITSSFTKEKDDERLEDLPSGETALEAMCSTLLRFPLSW